MEKILEALKSLLPSESVNEVAAAVEAMLSESRTELETEFNEKLEEAYQELSKELAQAEKTAEQGYTEAASIINDLRSRLDIQQEEFERTMEEEFEEAYQLILAERSKVDSVGKDMHEEYDKRLSEKVEFIIGKVDEFLQYKGSEIYEQAKRDVLNDPRMAEHKVALDKIVEITTNYLSDEDVALATSSKLDEAYRNIEKLHADLRMMEARNIRLDHDNRKLTESVRYVQESLNENTKNERKERAQKSKNVTGRGDSVLKENTRIINEHSDAKPEVKDDDADASPIMEGADLGVWNALAGTAKKAK